MFIKDNAELEGMKKVSEVVGLTLKKMREYTKAGMSTYEIDEYGGRLLKESGAKSAPYESYEFPGWTCISVNNVVAHGTPSKEIILKEGDLINIDVSAELDGFWSDNGGSFIVGEDINQHQPLVDASKAILKNAISKIKGGVKIADIGQFIEAGAKKAGFKVIRNLAGHGVGRSLHEDPEDILNYREKSNKQRFRKNSVVAIETFIATDSKYAVTPQGEEWNLVGDKGGFVTQHEHTIMVTDGKPLILTAANGIWE